MTTDSAALSMTGWALASRTRIRAFHAGRYVLILAEGEQPTPGHEVGIEPDRAMASPPRYDLMWRAREPLTRVVVPYRYSEVVQFPADQRTVTVRHADGEDQTEIEACGPELAEFEAAVSDRAGTGGAPGAVEVAGLSRDLRFEEAFAAARNSLPPYDPPGPDTLERIEVVAVEGLFGSLANLHHLVVRVQRYIIVN